MPRHRDLRWRMAYYVPFLFTAAPVEAYCVLYNTSTRTAMREGDSWLLGAAVTVGSIVATRV